MKRTFFVITVPISATLMMVGGHFTVAGDPNPPAGPVGGTMKTLTEVEPRIAINATNTPGDADSLFKITQPGSYYLTGNRQGVAGKHGIEIAASGVTLDLNGFDLVGVGGTLSGVRTTVASLTNIAVVNGSVRSWGGDGVDLATAPAFNCRVNNLLTMINAGNGITISNACMVSNCSANQNTNHGISTNVACTVTDCLAVNNGGIGINGNYGGTALNCSAYSNGGNGIAGFATFSNCSAYYNGGNGINAASGSTVSGCAASNNSGNGISAVVVCMIADCTARENTLDGIVCFQACVIRGNTCGANGNGGDGAGIHTTGNDNRIEGNNCTGADRGIDVDAAGNIIIKNTCSGNTTNNWDVVAGNVCLVVQGVAGAAILGNTGGVAPGSTDPNANFSY